MGGSMRMGSAKDKKPLEGANTKFFVGTEVCCEEWGYLERKEMWGRVVFGEFYSWNLMRDG